MFPREYRNFDVARWHSWFELCCQFVRSSYGDYWFMEQRIWRRPQYAFEYYQERNNVVALERALIATGEARRFEVEPAQAARIISDMKAWYGIENETREILDSLLADLNKWAHDAKIEAEAIAKANVEPKKKSFFKRIFSK